MIARDFIKNIISNNSGGKGGKATISGKGNAGRGGHSYGIYILNSEDNTFLETNINLEFIISKPE